MKLTEEQRSVYDCVAAGKHWASCIDIAEELGMSRYRVGLVLQQLKRRVLVKTRFKLYWEIVPSNRVLSGKIST